MTRKICPLCSVVFYRKQDRTTFCSLKCSNTATGTKFQKGHKPYYALLGKKLSDEHKRKLSESHKGQMPVNIDFIKSYWQGRKRSEDFCRAISERLRGEKSKWWKGGVTPLRAQIYNSYEYKKWRKDVFQRDNYTCQLCGLRGGYLEADHIKPFSLFPELRFDINNG
jgi:5-methylcytosine-specific restriction endonuclease McrA